MGEEHAYAKPQPMRCLTCGYVLEHLTEKRCPECGRAFDPRSADTYTRQQPKVLSHLWLPALGMAAVLMAVGFLLFASTLSWRMALLISGLAAGGTLVGYGWSWRHLRLALLIGFAMAVCVGVLQGGYVEAERWGTLYVAALMPAGLGWIFGTLLRQNLKTTSWSQAAYLPTLALVIHPVIGSLTR